MKTINFLESRPAPLPPGSRLYKLRWKPRYDAPSDEPPTRFATWRYFVSGLDPIDDAVLSLPVQDQRMFHREGAGPGTGGLLRIILSVRHPDITREQFGKHWREVHAPLAIGMNPSYDYYITNVVTDVRSEWDGVLEEWFADEEIFDAHDQGLTGWKKEIADDYALFLSTSSEAPQWLATELDANVSDHQ